MIRTILAALTILLQTITNSHAQEADAAKGQAIRLVCVMSLEKEETTYTLVSENEDGAWTEHGEVKLRDSFISDWIPCPSAAVQLAERQGDRFRPVAKIAIPTGSKQSLVILLPDPANHVYRADVFSPEKFRFRKGSTMAINYSNRPSTVMLGKRRGDIAPGKRKVLDPQPDERGMFRMLAAYKDASGKLIPCYDRFVSHTEEARELLLLLPDPTLGLKVFSLPEFGPFE